MCLPVLKAFPTHSWCEPRLTKVLHVCQASDLEEVTALILWALSHVSFLVQGMPMLACHLVLDWNFSTVSRNFGTSSSYKFFPLCHQFVTGVGDHGNVTCQTLASCSLQDTQQPLFCVSVLVFYLLPDQYCTTDMHPPKLSVTLSHLCFLHKYLNSFFKLKLIAPSSI